MEKTVTSIVILLVWCVYSILEGMREGYYYDAAVRADRQYPNIHWIYFVQRGILLFIVAITMDTLIFPISLAFIFPYIHYGYYYAQRNDLDVRNYPRRFKADSTTSTAFFEFSYMERVAFALTGCIFFIGYIFLINI
jgi:hypothetical protein